jgi:AraC-like DNA-binding protein
LTQNFDHSIVSSLQALFAFRDARFVACGFLDEHGGSSLYEHAAVNCSALGPLWHLGQDVTLFIGPLDYNASHQHGAPVFLAGIYAPFKLRVYGGDWQSCVTAIIPAGIRHELDIGGYPIAVFYVEPKIGIASLVPLANGACERDGILVGKTGELGLFRELYEDAAAPGWAGPALLDLLGFCDRHASHQIDARVSRTIDLILRNPDSRLPIPKIAASVNLSTSRMQHLFTREVGVPFRRYVAWNRMRIALRAIAKGGNFTTSAHEAGFYDQAHFNHDFYRTFGAPPSRSLTNLRGPEPRSSVPDSARAECGKV